MRKKVSTMVKTLGVDEWVEVGHIKVTLTHIDDKVFSLDFENCEGTDEKVPEKVTVEGKQQIILTDTISVIAYKKNSNVKRAMLVISAPQEVKIRHLDQLSTK